MKTNGMIPLFCRITVDGQEVRFGMKRDVHPKHWDVKAGKATGRSDEATETNTLIDSTKSAIFKVYRELQERDNSVTAEKVKNVFLGIDAGQNTLLTVFDEINRKKEPLVGKTLSKPVYDRYLMVRNHMAEFLKKERNLTDIPLRDIDHKFICDFESFTIVSRGCNENSTAKYLHIFKHVIINAIKLRLIYYNPFDDYQIKRNKVDRGFLTQEEVEILMKQQFKSKRLERVRDIFVFCCFTGLSHIDVRNLSKDNICTMFDGKTWITGKRGKTDVTYQVPLLEIPQKILEKYKGKTRNGKLLPVIKNSETNLTLREIIKQSGITKKVTFHLSRHTFATLTLSKGVSIESVSKMLGHKSIKMTQHDAKILEKTVVQEMSKLSNKLNYSL
jgi:integrase